MPIMDAQLEKRLVAGEIVLGGCFIMGDDPEHHCSDCGHEWRTSPPDALE
jgi:hypothetical protein